MIRTKNLRIKKNKLVILLNMLFYVFIIAIIISTTIFMFSTEKNKSIFGFRHYTILSDSMFPTYKKGDLIFIKLASYEEVKVNDAITFYINDNSPITVTHRVTKILHEDGKTKFITKGDKNNSEDIAAVDGENVVGIVCGSFPKLGSIINTLINHIFIIVTILVVLIILNIYTQTFNKTRKSKYKRKYKF